MSRKRRRGVRMEMTPMLDVMFLVMVFFIYCIFDMAVHRGVKVDLPDAEGKKEPGEKIVITIKADDMMQLNGMDMPRDEIISRVKALKKAGMKMPVLVSGDRKSSLGTGIGLLKDLEGAGVKKAAFQVSGSK